MTRPVYQYGTPWAVDKKVLVLLDDVGQKENDDLFPEKARLHFTHSCPRLIPIQTSRRRRD